MNPPLRRARVTVAALAAPLAVVLSLLAAPPAVATTGTATSVTASSVTGTDVTGTNVTGTTTAGPAVSATTPCADVEVVFARGTGQPAGLGDVGQALVTALTAQLHDRTVAAHAVGYAASADQSSAGPGATALTRHAVARAQECPATQLVLGGYSQGASVVTIALGIRTSLGTGEVLPADVAHRVAAVVTFGNPLGLSGRTIPTASATYGARALDDCNPGDPVCGGGSRWSAHLSYDWDGSATAGAEFAAARVREGSPPGEVTCVTASTRDHVLAGRAVPWFGVAYARGSYDRLGPVSRDVVVALVRLGDRSWGLVPSC